MPNLNPHIPADRLVLHTVHTDDGATELYFARANDDTELDWSGTILFQREGGFTYKLWTPDEDVPLVVHVEGARVRVVVSEDQPPFYGEDGRAGVILLDSDEVKWPVPSPNADATATYEELVEGARDLLEPGEEHLNPEYVRGLVNLIANVFGKPEMPTGERMEEVARDMHLPPEHFTYG